MMKLFRLSQSPSPEYSDPASWTTRGHFSNGVGCGVFGEAGGLGVEEEEYLG
jgi:hypothetical protein